jgi:hypothetical protein
MKRRIGDRRLKNRFEIVGDLWGTMETTATLLVRNLGPRGALLESPFALEPDSMHWVQALVDGEAQPLRFRVRHATGDVASQGPYLIGVEFVVVNAQTQAFIDRHCGAAGAAETT